MFISCYVGIGDKGNANITYGFSCTWQAPNRTTAARTSLLCEVWETDRHCWKLIRLVLMCTVYKKRFRFPEVASSMQIVCYPSQGAKASVPSSISWMNARYEATTVGREMWITYNAVCIIIHEGLENVETFSSRPRPRPRPFFMSSRRLETKTMVSRLHLCALAKQKQTKWYLVPKVLF